MLVTVEEHDRHRVVKLVHLIEVWDPVKVAYIDDGEVLGARLLAAVRSTLGVYWSLTLYPLSDLVEELILADTWENGLVWELAMDESGTNSRDRGLARIGSPPGVLLQRGWPGPHAKLFASEG